MKQYLDLLKEVMVKGTWKGNRTGIDAKGISGYEFKHDLREGFPLLTTKRMAKKTVKVELEGFIGGITDKRWYQERGCKIWNSWCNPCRVPKGLSDDETKAFQKQEHDLGPIYGYQWRNYGAHYVNVVSDPICVPFDPREIAGDQLASIVTKLKENPNDRRMVCSAQNPNQLNQMALPPCHFAWNLVHIDGVLNLNYSIRSNDLFLGAPFNIASYAYLLHLLAHYSGLEAGILRGDIMDAHIYENHMEQVEEQISREPLKLCEVKTVGGDTIFDWTHDMTTEVGYESHDPIKASVAV